MSVIRTFIAVETSEETRSRAASLCDRLRTSGMRVTWTRPENMHLTLKFLGDTEEALLANVKETVANVAASLGPFSVRFRGAGAFPDARRPQTLWIGVSDGQDSLVELATRIDDALHALGIPREKRRFTPHLTIGRVRSGSAAEQKSLGDMIRKHAEFDAATAEIRQVLVMASQLSPAGATYEVQSTAPLHGV